MATDAPVKSQRLSAYKAAKRPAYCTTFTDPRNHKRRNCGLSTTDLTEAKEICVDLERIINDRRLWKLSNPLLHSLHKKAVSIFFDGNSPKPLNISVEDPDSVGFEFDPKTGLYERTSSSFDSVELKRALQKLTKAERKIFELEQKVTLLSQENLDLRRAANKHINVELHEAIKVWKTIYPDGRAAHTVKEATASLTSFQAHVKAGIKIGEIRAGHIDEWIAGYRTPKSNKNVTPQTKRRVRAYVSSFFSWATRKYDLSQNPFDKTDSIPGTTRSPENIRAIRRYEELTTLLDSLKPWPYWRAWVAVAMLAGPRWKEQASLRRSDVYLESGYLRITTQTSGNTVRGTKTGRERNIPIEKNILFPILQDHIATLREEPTPWLFPTTVEQLSDRLAEPGQWAGSSTFLSTLNAILKSAQESIAKDGEFWTFGPREYRHCFGTALGHSGVDVNRIARFMGNSPDVAQRHYIAPINEAKWPLEWPAFA